MKIFITLFLVTFFSTYAQNADELADTEFRKYLNDFENFNLDSLTTKKFIHFEVQPPFSNTGIQRDFNITEDKVYVIIIPNGWDFFLDYNLHIFKENDSIIGVIVKEYSNFKYYFKDYKLPSLVAKHNDFYNTSLTVSEYLNELLEMEIYGYYCGYSPVYKEVPEKDDFLFDKLENIEVFRKWLGSPNLELQTYGVDAMEYLKKHTKFKFRKEDHKLIKHIKHRNSLINTCSGCNAGIFKKVF